jgi:hypothetical protein
MGRKEGKNKDCQPISVDVVVWFLRSLKTEGRTVTAYIIHSAGKTRTF